MDLTFWDGERKITRMGKIIFTAILSAAATLFADGGKQASEAIEWRDMSKIGLEGKAWSDTEYPYGRLPLRAKEKTTKAVWNNSHSSTGMCINFETDSPKIWVKREFLSKQLGEYNFNVCAFSGFDLYTKDAGGKFRMLATTPHNSSEKSEYRLTQTDGKKRVYRLYLPLRNTLLSAQLGVEKGSYFRAIPAREKPVVFYGSSIVHGAFASHAGLSHPSLIGRRLDVPIVNLGFSGAAKMEPEIADLLAEIDASAYVIDAQPNMGAKLVSERCEKFLRRLRKLRPDTPILLAERVEHNRAWLIPQEGNYVKQMWKIQRGIYDRLVAEGEKRMLYMEGENLYGADGEGSIDGIHPNDLGIMNIANRMTPILEKLLEKK